MQRLNAASCLFLAFLAAAVCAAAERVKVQVVQTHTGIKLGLGGLEGDPVLTRCTGATGRYSREFGFHCGPDIALAPAANQALSEYAFFYDVRVVMPNASRVVYHCSTILDADCQGFPVYPEATSVVCSDFVFSGRAYKDCTATGGAAEAIGIYPASFHGDRMTIFGPHWRRQYLQNGTWGFNQLLAQQDPKPAPQQESKPTVPPESKPPAEQDPNPATSDTKPPARQDSTPPAPDPKAPAQPDPNPAQSDPKPAQPDANPAAQPDPKPSPAPDSGSPSAPETNPPVTGHSTDESRSDTPPVPRLSPALAEPVIDPRVIEQAKAGDPVAQYKLGYDYFQGHGVPIDYVQAAVWWRKAADQGYPQAQNNLGVLYNAGKGVPQSYAEAYFWQNLAAARASAAQQALFAKNRDESGARLWLLTRLKVQQRAAKWAADHPVAPRAHEPTPDEKRGEYP